MRIIIFGVGHFFELISSSIDYCDSIVAYVDNKIQNQGKVIDEVKVYPVREIKTLNFDKVVLCSNCTQEMKKQLLDLGVEETRICSYQDYFKNKGRKHKDVIGQSLDSKFDVDYFRSNHTELSRFSDAELIHYYGQYGEINGLVGSKSGSREGIVSILDDISKEGASILEIGPFDNPKCKGINVKYFDIFDSDRLKLEAKERGRENYSVPEKIDFVSDIGDLTIIDEQFDVVFSSHSIEHQPNLIKHLNNVDRILNHNGFYVLIIPDARYSFDYYSPLSTVGKIIEDYENNRIYNSLSDILNMSFFRTHNDSLRHWKGDHGKPYGVRKEALEKEAYVSINGEHFCDTGMSGANKIQDLISAYQKSLEEGKYIDAHSNRFTPSSFEYIIYTLKELGYIDLDILCVHNTIYGRQEFCAVLQKK